MSFVRNVISKLVIKEGIKLKKKENLENKRTRCEVYSRVVGYLRPVNQWNKGKQQEYSDRKMFKQEKEEKVKVQIQ